MRVGMQCAGVLKKAKKARSSKPKRPKKAEPEKAETKGADAEKDYQEFLADMFFCFAAEPESDECGFAYWSDGIEIHRERTNDGVWKYRTFPG